MSEEFEPGKATGALEAQRRLQPSDPERPSRVFLQGWPDDGPRAGVRGGPELAGRDRLLPWPILGGPCSIHAILPRRGHRREWQEGRVVQCGQTGNTEHARAHKR